MISRKHNSLKDQFDFIANDKYLRALAINNIEMAEKIYKEWNNSENLSLKCLEIGGAGGITKILRPNWIVTDVRPAEGIDFLASAEALPFPDESFDIIFAIDVIHHIPDKKLFFSEISRLLSKGEKADIQKVKDGDGGEREGGGIFFVREPYWGIPAQFIWRFLHPEVFSLKKLKEVKKTDDPMYGNQALAYSLIKKRKFTEEDLVPRNLELNVIGPVNGIAFLLSGGNTFSTKVNRSIILKIDKWENNHPTWLKLFGFSIQFYYRKIN